MTVAELIAALQQIDGDLPVYVAGKEGGVDDVTHLHVSHFERGENDPAEHWHGVHEHHSEGVPNGVEIYARRS